jgi:hypothetical protein
MALSAFGKNLLVSRPCAVELSVWMGVHVCGWPNSLSVLCIDAAILALMNSAPSLALLRKTLLLLLFAIC